MKHHSCVKEVRLGHKGQFTIPKRIRDEALFQCDDIFQITHMPDDSLLLQRLQDKKGIDLLLEAIKDAPKINWREAWEEIKEERKRD